jgi:protein-L-isoaspartate(D-aspartate) O-methyltransferase
VLEIGTGSGYQAAVLAEIAAEVYSVELDPQLAAEAEQRLQRLGYANVHTRPGDGWAGWPEHAPYDAILVTAAARSVPPPLLEQLAGGGRLVIPLDAGPFVQDLTLVTRAADGSVSARAILPVMFVPFRRGPAPADETPGPGPATSGAGAEPDA